MHTYFCESCGAQVDIEEIEAVLSPPEYYEFGKCIPCFEQEDN